MKWTRDAEACLKVEIVVRVEHLDLTLTDDLRQIEDNLLAEAKRRVEKALGTDGAGIAFLGAEPVSVSITASCLKES